MLMDREYRTENQEQKTESSSSPIKAIFDKFAKHRDVNLVYGDPITHEEQRVIPVTKMRYSFGGGSGGKKNNKNEDSSNVRVKSIFMCKFCFYVFPEYIFSYLLVW